ncbi:hypothetical protein SUGI_0359960 [Cryptomeria japonica]|nr:hypothetical protein SUGI_0359960 [Cryptomeria japonica]
MDSFNCKAVCPRTGRGEANQHSFHNSLPWKSKIYVGLGKSVGDLKELLFQSDVSIVGVHCMGGGGKTTLAMALCDDPGIKGRFGSIVFIIVSESPNLKGILETIWGKIVGGKVPEFQNVEDAHIQLQQQLLKQSKPTLVVLDDVWSRASLEKLLFEAPGYKTLITTRDASTIPRNASTRLYRLPLLNEEDALSLFCFSAFGQTSIPSTADANLVIEVQAECKGLPLALTVVGNSLYGEPHVAWENAKRKLSQGQPISTYHEERLFKCLKTSIDYLDDAGRECFLDTASFPEDKKTCVDALLNIWVYVRKMEWQDAYIMLLELARKNLLNLNQRSRTTISYGCASEMFFWQHDVMRDLALYLGCQDDIFYRKRLLMPRKEDNLPGEWELCKDRPFNAQIVSIHTGSMAENEWKWNGMNLPESEALVLHFSAREYFLPPFLKTMKKLKVLIVCNLGSHRATLKGLDALSSLTQLRCLRLESDLEELPLAICHMPSAQRWSVTNCHLVEMLPHNLGSLSSIRMLRLSALPALKELPTSIGKLEQLEYLDISLCEGLKDLPDEVGQLKKLKEFDMTECSRLRRLPKTVCGLSSLKHVICDEKIGNQWLKAKAISIPELRVEIVEPQFTLDWLDD